MLPVGLRVAMRLLTVLPLRWDPREAQLAGGTSVVWFPFIGLLIGAAVYASLLLPWPELPRAAVALAVWITLSGALHEDAVMDCADAALAPVDQPRRLEILKDPHVGAFGVTAEALLVVLRLAALAALSPAAALVAPLAGRWSMLLTVSMHASRASGPLSSRYARGARPLAGSAIALLMSVVLTIVTHEARLLVGVLAGVLAGVWAARLLGARLGVVNGDVHGCAGVIAEVVTLYAGLPV